MYSVLLHLESKLRAETRKQDAFTKAVLIDVCGCLKTSHLIILSIISNYVGKINKGNNRNN
jgi:hypothetical protein